MKVAHLVCTFPPYHGGIGNTCWHEAEGLSSEHQITVLTPMYHPNQKIHSDHFGLVYLRPWLKYGNAAWVPQITKHLSSFDIIHLHWPFIGGAKAVLCWKMFHPKKKLVVQYQMDLVGQGIFKIIFSAYRWIFLPLMVKLADKIIVSTFDYAEHSQLRKFFKKHPDKFIAIPLGVEVNKFYPESKNLDLMNRYGLSFDDSILLFVGGLDQAHYFKGLENLLRAVGVLAKEGLAIKLLIVGQGELKDHYQKLSQLFGIKDRVIFADAVSDTDLPQYYNLADIFVLPSVNQSESFGLVNLMAMACAKPIVVSDLPGVRTLVQNKINGFRAIPNDPEDLREKIKFLINNKSLREEWGRRNREMVENKYSWTVVNHRLKDLYQEIACK